MNFKFKIDDIIVKSQQNKAPVDIELQGIEISVENVDLREIPQILTTFKDVVSELDHESFERELIREDINRNNTSPSQFTTPRMSPFAEVLALAIK